MIREQEIYILEWSKKFKKNITHITLFLKTVIPNICRFQWLENDIKLHPNNPFRSSKYSRQRKYFSWKLNWFVCKTLHPWKSRVFSIKLNPSLSKNSRVEKRNVKKHPKQNDLHGNFNFKKRASNYKNSSCSPFSTNSPHPTSVSGSKYVLVRLLKYWFSIS